MTLPQAGLWFYLACLIASSTMGQDAKPNWKIYSNARFAFAVCYPQGVLLPKGESDNGDGETFALGRGDGKVLVFGHWANATPSGRTPSMAVEYAQAVRQNRSEGLLPGSSVLESSFFVISASGGGRIRYQKTMRAGDRDVTLVFDYSEAAKPMMDGIVSKMSECLTAGKN